MNAKTINNLQEGQALVSCLWSNHRQWSLSPDNIRSRRNCRTRPGMNHLRFDWSGTIDQMIDWWWRLEFVSRSSFRQWSITSNQLFFTATILMYWTGTNRQLMTDWAWTEWLWWLWWRMRNFITRTNAMNGSGTKRQWMANWTRTNW